jgi:DNA polymerase elongation subunit (family B)
MTIPFKELQQILFLDIETASLEESFSLMPPRLQEEWGKKEKYILQKTHTPENYQLGDLFFQKAGIYAEFAKIICVGVGYFHYKEAEDQLEFRQKIFAKENEKELLEDFAQLLQKKKWTLCAHNGKEFDYPFLSRRTLINRLPLPELLKISGRKPWEVSHLDTLDMWKFGDYKNYTSLELLATLFDIPTSKDGIDGSQVNERYHIKKDLGSIKDYCLRDVWVTAQVYLALKAYSIEKNIEIKQVNEH